MKTYVIERDIPGVENMGRAQLKDAAGTSNEALAKLAPKVQWVESFVAKGKTFCIYRAEAPECIQEHARLSGFPASIITEVTAKFDPTTASA